MEICFITKRSRRIPNAWHFRFALNLVFTAQWFRFGGSVAHHLTRRYEASLFSLEIYDEKRIYLPLASASRWLLSES